MRSSFPWIVIPSYLCMSDPSAPCRVWVSLTQFFELDPDPIHAKTQRIDGYPQPVCQSLSPVDQELLISLVVIQHKVLRFGRELLQTSQQCLESKRFSGVRRGGL